MTVDKLSALNRLRQTLIDLDTSPLYSYRLRSKYIPLVGEGDIDAQVMFIGEAPGEKEAQTGRPFIGPSGQKLTQLLNQVGVKRSQVYLTSIVKDRPPQNRTPTPQEVKAYLPLMQTQLQIIQPRILVLLGKFAASVFSKLCRLPQLQRPISQIHGQRFQISSSYSRVELIPTFHPAACLYRPDQEPLLLADLKSIFPA